MEIIQITRHGVPFFFCGHPAWAGAAFRRVFSVAWLRGYFSRSTHLCYTVYAAGRRSVHKQFQPEDTTTQARMQALFNIAKKRTVFPYIIKA